MITSYKEHMQCKVQQSSANTQGQVSHIHELCAFNFSQGRFQAGTAYFHQQLLFSVIIQHCYSQWIKW